MRTVINPNSICTTNSSMVSLKFSKTIVFEEPEPIDWAIVNFTKGRNTVDTGDQWVDASYVIHALPSRFDSYGFSRTGNLAQFNWLSIWIRWIRTLEMTWQSDDAWFSWKPSMVRRMNFLTWPLELFRIALLSQSNVTFYTRRTSLISKTNQWTDWIQHGTLHVQISALQLIGLIKQVQLLLQFSFHWFVRIFFKWKPDRFWFWNADIENFFRLFIIDHRYSDVWEMNVKLLTNGNASGWNLMMREKHFSLDENYWTVKDEQRRSDVDRQKRVKLFAHYDQKQDKIFLFHFLIWSNLDKAKRRETMTRIILNRSSNTRRGTVIIFDPHQIRSSSLFIGSAHV